MALESEPARRNFGQLANLAKGLDASPFSQVWQWVRDIFLDYFDRQARRN
jgi:hypothetical protein